MPTRQGRTLSYFRTCRLPVNKTEDICKLGDEIIVKCIGIDDKGRVKLSRRAAMEENKPTEDTESSNEGSEEEKQEAAEPVTS